MLGFAPGCGLPVFDMHLPFFRYWVKLPQLSAPPVDDEI
jgi:hypothetical protein